MPPSARERLEHIAQSIETIHAYVAGKVFTDYEQDPLLRDAVERRFTIIAAAIRALDEMHTGSGATRISDYKRIIGFRNVLVYRYYETDNSLVWRHIQTELPLLLLEVEELLGRRQ